MLYLFLELHGRSTAKLGPVGQMLPGFLCASFVVYKTLHAPFHSSAFHFCMHLYKLIQVTLTIIMQESQVFIIFLSHTHIYIFRV